MSTKKTETAEITSFNDTVPAVATLLEIDEKSLDAVVGGNCPRLQDCDTYGNCTVNKPDV